MSLVKIEHDFSQQETEERVTVEDEDGNKTP